MAVLTSFFKTTFFKVLWLGISFLPGVVREDFWYRKLQIVPIDTVDEFSGEFIYETQITSAQENTDLLDPEETYVQKLIFPELRVRHIPHGHFVLNSRFNGVIHGERILIAPRTEKGPWKIFLGYRPAVVAGVVAQRSFEVLLRRPSKTQHYPRGLYVGTRAPYNWYHWLANTLPSLHIANRAETTFDLPVFLPREISQSPTMLDSLDVFRRDRPIIWIEGGVQYSVRELFWADSPVADSPFSQNPRERLPLIHHPSAMGNFRDTIISAVRHEKLPGPGPKRVFLSRRDNSARPYNQDEVEDCLQLHGFVTMYIEDMSFAQQVAVFQRAKFIIGPSGAALANIIFCTPGTTVLRLVGSAQPFENYFTNLASIGGARITDLHGENTKPELSDHYYNIELSRLEYAIRHVEQAENV